MSKIVEYELEGNAGTTERGWRFWCPACCMPHMFCTVPAGALRPNGTRSHVWAFDGNFEQPTFTPSLHYQHHRGNWGDTDLEGNTTWIPEGNAITDCHLVVTKGCIAYMGDCPHEFKGETIDMVEWPETPNDRDVLRHMAPWRFRDGHCSPLHRLKSHHKANVITSISLRVRARTCDDRLPDPKALAKVLDALRNGPQYPADL